MVNSQLNLSLNVLRFIAEHRNISDYENKSAKDLIKALRGPKPTLEINKNMLKEIKEDFYNFRLFLQFLQFQNFFSEVSKKKQISIANLLKIKN